jgi:lipoprotein-releasing system permease protein
MYKLLLIWRYLLTRRIALVSVVSVTLGVATMIVVNAVMLGFSREMENRIHGALSDVTVSSYSLRGFDDVDARIRDAQKVAGDMIDAITPTVTTPGMLSFEFGGGEVITRQVQIVGIDAATNERVTAIAQYLQHPENRKALSFDLREDGYDVQNPTFGADGVVRKRLAEAGWKKRRADAENVGATRKVVKVYFLRERRFGAFGLTLLDLVKSAKSAKSTSSSSGTSSNLGGATGLPGAVFPRPFF